MSQTISEIRLLLTRHLDAPDSDVDQTSHMIDFLVGIIRAYELGEYSTKEVLAHFRRHVPTFDILLWIRSKEAEGVYGEDDPADDDDEPEVST